MLRACLRPFNLALQSSCMECSSVFTRQMSAQQRWFCERPDSDATPSTSGEPSAQLQGSRSREPHARFSPVLRNLRLNLPGSLSDLIPPLEMRSPTPDSMRTGMIAIKVGMVSEWDEHGVLTPFTVLWFDDNEVTQVKAQPFDVTTSLQIGCGSKKAKRLAQAQIGFFLKQGVPFKSKLVEFKVSPDALMPVGTKLSAAHFVAGHYVDVTALTKGKGFQGGMKRWGFSGQGASHGVSLAHRSPGSIGQQGYARVLPGKKMAGRMGGERRLTRNLWIHRVDPQRNLIWLKGTVHGPQGAYVQVCDARRKQSEQLSEYPFPTHVGELPEPTQAKPVRNLYDAYKD